MVVQVFWGHSTRYTKSKSNYSPFTKKNGKSFTALLIYVDDLLITGYDLVGIKKLTTFLNSRFFIQDLDDLK